MTATAIRDALTTAMRHSAAPMVLCDPHVADMPMLAANQAFVDLTGYPIAEIIGRNCRFLQGPRTDPVSPPRIRACLDAGQGCIEWIVNYRRDGTPFYNVLFISPVRDVDGSLLFFFGNQLDITLGSPDWLNEIHFGSAHVVPALEEERCRAGGRIGADCRSRASSGRNYHKTAAWHVGRIQGSPLGASVVFSR
jgi:PAS domain S-box-containing protein